jgi:hypothetical protein
MSKQNPEYRPISVYIKENRQCFCVHTISAVEGTNRGLSIEELGTKRFEQGLTDEYPYYENGDALFYLDQKHRVAIRSERSWRAAMNYMYYDGSSRFEFVVEGQVEQN